MVDNSQAYATRLTDGGEVEPSAFKVEWPNDRQAYAELFPNGEFTLRFRQGDQFQIMAPRIRAQALKAVRAVL